MQQERTLLDNAKKGYISKKVLPKTFFKLSAKTFLCVLGHTFNKINGSIFQNPDPVGTLEMAW